MAVFKSGQGHKTSTPRSQNSQSHIPKIKPIYYITPNLTYTAPRRLCFHAFPSFNTAITSGTPTGPNNGK